LMARRDAGRSLSERLFIQPSISSILLSMKSQREPV
jgi:hypothetical protein